MFVLSIYLKYDSTLSSIRQYQPPYLADELLALKRNLQLCAFYRNRGRIRVALPKGC